jgi:hypothetical protein
MRLIFSSICLLLVTSIYCQQECLTKLLATKSFPSADDKLIWANNKPTEYFFGGEKIHVQVTGEMNYMPERKAEDKGGVFGMFKSHVEWIEAHPKSPANKPPDFSSIAGVDLDRASIKVNGDGSYECDLRIQSSNSLGDPITLGALVLNSSELSGSGGETTGQYKFEFTVDNSERLKLVRDDIKSNIARLSSSSATLLRSLFAKDSRMLCRYSDQIGQIIFEASTGLMNDDKQAALTYASELSPKNNIVVLELAKTFSQVPKGCEAQKTLLQRITSMSFDPADFVSLNNSAQAFDLISTAYLNCMSDFKDPLGIDSLRKFLRSASTEFGLVYDYPKQIQAAVRYADLELYTNEKEKILDAAKFLEETRFKVPSDIEEVSEKERQAFFSKFGNLSYLFYRDILDSLSLEFHLVDFPLSTEDLNKLDQDQQKKLKTSLQDVIKVLIRKHSDSSTTINYSYVDNFQINSALSKVQSHISCLIDKNNKIKQFDYSSDDPNYSTWDTISYSLDKTNNDTIKKYVTEFFSSFINLLNLPRYCPSAKINSEGHVEHNIGSLQLSYFIDDNNYGINSKYFLPFLIFSKPDVFFTSNKMVNNNLDDLIINQHVKSNFKDGTLSDWQLTDISFH